MKAFLMHPDRDFDMKRPPPAHTPALVQDLELTTLLQAMGGTDEFLCKVAKAVLLNGSSIDVTTVRYRQSILQDCLRTPRLVRELYDLTVKAIERRGTHWLGIFSQSPHGILYESRELIDWYLTFFRKLRAIADREASQFRSEGFTRLFASVRRELDDRYLMSVQMHLKELSFNRGVLLSARLTPGLDGTGYILRRPEAKLPNWFQRLLRRGGRSYTFSLPDRDEAGARILSDIEDQGINHVANALAQSSDHIQSFFESLRMELGFYVGCLNIYEKLVARRVPICFPGVYPVGSGERNFRNLHDPSLALTLPAQTVGNDFAGDRKSLAVITGANQGGKSSFLRSVGIAQLMLQSGLFVAASEFNAELCTAVFTHYKRSEDASMKSGKFDEELARMSEIASQLRPNALILFNESFASTNEREGSEVARQIVSALQEVPVRIFFVTHLYDFAHSLFENRKDAKFLRAQRRPDGSRTFHLEAGEPLPTSFGRDLYTKIFDGNPIGRTAG
ncbi:MAG: MutS-related protein [Phycisphaerae bacterium]